jgi:hypothetical protein
MPTQALIPDAPAIKIEGDRRYVTVPWNEAEVLRAALHKCGCPTTLCLNPETRQARLELWPGVSPEAVLALLEVRTPPPAAAQVTTASPAAIQRAPAATDPICV